LGKQAGNGANDTMQLQMNSKTSSALYQTTRDPRSVVVTAAVVAGMQEQVEVEGKDEERVKEREQENS